MKYHTESQNTAILASALCVVVLAEHNKIISDEQVGAIREGLHHLWPLLHGSDQQIY